MWKACFGRRRKERCIRGRNASAQDLSNHAEKGCVDAFVEGCNARSRSVGAFDVPRLQALEEARRDALVLAATPACFAIISLCSRAALHQNDTSKRWMGDRVHKVPKMQGAREPAADSVPDEDVLELIFSLEPEALARMLQELVREGDVWKGIVRVPPFIGKPDRSDACDASEPATVSAGAVLATVNTATPSQLASPAASPSPPAAPSALLSSSRAPIEGGALQQLGRMRKLMQRISRGSSGTHPLEHSSTRDGPGGWGSGTRDLLIGPIRWRFTRGSIDTAGQPGEVDSDPAVEFESDSHRGRGGGAFASARRSCIQSGEPLRDMMMHMLLEEEGQSMGDPLRPPLVAVRSHAASASIVPTHSTADRPSPAVGDGAAQELGRNAGVGSARSAFEQLYDVGSPPVSHRGALSKQDTSSGVSSCAAGPTTAIAAATSAGGGGPAGSGASRAAAAAVTTSGGGRSPRPASTDLFGGGRFRDNNPLSTSTLAMSFTRVAGMTTVPTLDVAAALEDEAAVHSDGCALPGPDTARPPAATDWARARRERLRKVASCFEKSSGDPQSTAAADSSAGMNCTTSHMSTSATGTSTMYDGYPPGSSVGVTRSWMASGGESYGMSQMATSTRLLTFAAHLKSAPMAAQMLARVAPGSTGSPAAAVAASGGAGGAGGGGSGSERRRPASAAAAAATVCAAGAVDADDDADDATEGGDDVGNMTSTAVRTSSVPCLNALAMARLPRPCSMPHNRGAAALSQWHRSAVSRFLALPAQNQNPECSDGPRRGSGSPPLSGGGSGGGTGGAGGSGGSGCSPAELMVMAAAARANASAAGAAAVAGDLVDLAGPGSQRREDDSMSSFLLLPGSSGGRLLGTCSSMAQPCYSSNNTLRLEPWFRPGPPLDTPQGGSSSVGVRSSLSFSTTNAANAAFMSTGGAATTNAAYTGGGAAAGPGSTSSLAGGVSAGSLTLTPSQQQHAANAAAGSMLSGTGTWVAGAPHLLSHHHHHHHHHHQRHEGAHMQQHQLQRHQAGPSILFQLGGVPQPLAAAAAGGPQPAPAGLQPHYPGPSVQKQQQQQQPGKAAAVPPPVAGPAAAGPVLQLRSGSSSSRQPQRVDVVLSSSPFERQLQLPHPHPHPHLQPQAQAIPVPPPPPPPPQEQQQQQRRTLQLSGLQGDPALARGSTRGSAWARPTSEPVSTVGVAEGGGRARPLSAAAGAVRGAGEVSHLAGLTEADVAMEERGEEADVDEDEMPLAPLPGSPHLPAEDHWGGRRGGQLAAALRANGPPAGDIGPAAAAFAASASAGGASAGEGGESGSAPRGRMGADDVIGMLRQALASQDRGGRRSSKDDCWHEIWATRAVDPVTREDVVVLVQHDVTAKVVAERHLALVMETEHRLLEQLFPRHILAYMTEDYVAKVAAAAAGGHQLDANWRPTVRDCKALATWHPQVTLLFADIKGFTPMCKEVEPPAVMAMLNDLYSRYDKMLDEYGVFKVETIGDCYFVAGGLVHEDEHGMPSVRGGSITDPLHAEKVFAFAKGMLAAAQQVRLPTTGKPVEIRIGIHSGPVVSGVVGTRMPRFCLFGDTVNTASRMESTGVPGAIHASEASYQLLRSADWTPTGGIEVKGKGRLQTYLFMQPGATTASGSTGAAAGAGPGASLNPPPMMAPIIGPFFTLGGSSRSLGTSYGASTGSSAIMFPHNPPSPQSTSASHRGSAASARAMAVAAPFHSSLTAGPPAAAMAAAAAVPAAASVATAPAPSVQDPAGEAAALAAVSAATAAAPEAAAGSPPPPPLLPLPLPLPLQHLAEESLANCGPDGPGGSSGGNARDRGSANEALLMTLTAMKDDIKYDIKYDSKGDCSSGVPSGPFSTGVDATSTTAAVAITAAALVSGRCASTNKISGGAQGGGPAGHGPQNLFDSDDSSDAVRAAAAAAGVRPSFDGFPRARANSIDRSSTPPVTTRIGVVRAAAAAAGVGGAMQVFEAALMLMAGAEEDRNSGRSGGEGSDNLP